MKSQSNIHDVLDFLRLLGANNDRVWFKANKEALFDPLRNAWEQDMARLISLMAEWDEKAQGLDVKQAVYRIYRDIRFSHDKRPYKQYFSGVIGRGGRHTRVLGARESRPRSSSRPHQWRLPPAPGQVC